MTGPVRVQLRLFVLTALVSRRGVQSSSWSAMGGVRLASNEDEARGMFLRAVGAEKPSFAVEELLCAQVADEKILEAAAEIANTPQEVQHG